MTEYFFSTLYCYKHLTNYCIVDESELRRSFTLVRSYISMQSLRIGRNQVKCVNGRSVTVLQRARVISCWGRRHWCWRVKYVLKIRRGTGWSVEYKAVQLLPTVFHIGFYSVWWEENKCSVRSHQHLRGREDLEFLDEIWRSSPLTVASVGTSDLMDGFNSWWTDSEETLNQSNLNLTWRGDVVHHLFGFVTVITSKLFLVNKSLLVLVHCCGITTMAFHFLQVGISFALIACNGLLCTKMHYLDNDIWSQASALAAGINKPLYSPDSAQTVIRYYYANVEGGADWLVDKFSTYRCSVLRRKLLETKEGGCDVTFLYARAESQQGDWCWVISYSLYADSS